MSDSIEALLRKYQPDRSVWGLERIEKVLSALAFPNEHIPVIHVTGTNGKGSVCAYISSVLRQAGYRVGRYTSPHLVSWAERICINDEPIAAEDFQRVLAEVQAAIPTDQDLTLFETLTALAWVHFGQQQVDIAVLEVGMGGRLDATNVSRRTIVSVVTPISRDHCHVLGNTLDAIALEKSGIFRAGCPVVTAIQSAEAAAMLQSRAKDMGCELVIAPPCEEISAGQARFVDQQGMIEFAIPLAGEIQLTNAAIAIAALRSLQRQGWSISDRDIQLGLAQTRWPGRLQWLTWQDQPLLIDGAHNIAGIASLRRYVDRHLQASSSEHHSVSWVVGILSGKEHEAMLGTLLRSGDRLYVVPVNDTRSADPQNLALLAGKICPDLGHCQAYDDVFLALQQAQTDQRQGMANTALTVLCGSLYLIGFFLQRLQQQASHLSLSLR